MKIYVEAPTTDVVDNIEDLQEGAYRDADGDVVIVTPACHTTGVVSRVALYRSGLGGGVVVAQDMHGPFTPIPAGEELKFKFIVS